MSIQQQCLNVNLHNTFCTRGTEISSSNNDRTPSYVHKRLQMPSHTKNLSLSQGNPRYIVKLASTALRVAKLPAAEPVQYLVFDISLDL